MANLGDTLPKIGRIRPAAGALVLEDDETGARAWLPLEDVDRLRLGDVARLYAIDTDGAAVPAGHAVESQSGAAVSVLIAGRHYIAISAQVRSAINRGHKAALFRAD